jgi:5-methylcytosine-specific restriction endonuclease McrA
MNEYQSPEWKELSKRILKRDNYTCKICKLFSPNLGQVQIFDEVNSNIELHQYSSGPDRSLYSFTSANDSLTIDIDFFPAWLVTPVLNVHHSRYINGKLTWEYDDEELHTLCRQCHTKLHQDIEIPIYSSPDTYSHHIKTNPKDTGTGRAHNHRPWVFIEKDKNNNEYQVSSVKPTMTYLILGTEDNEEVKRKAKKLLDYFFKKYLPEYSQKPHSL